MTSNYSFIPTTLTDVENINVAIDLPIYKELAFDFDTKQLKTIGGHYFYVEKNEALEIWIYKALNASRFSYLAYTTNYGNEIYTLVGRYLKGDILYSELKRLIEEALLVNPYITFLSDFKVEQKGADVYCTFGVNTIYGTIARQYKYEG